MSVVQAASDERARQGSTHTHRTHGHLAKHEKVHARNRRLVLSSRSQESSSPDEVSWSRFRLLGGGGH